MSTMLRFQNDDLSSEFMSVSELERVCPVVFKDTPTNPNVSGRYVQANTYTVIKDLERLGWYPVDAKQCRKKKGSSGIRSFHLVAFQNPDVKICGIDGGVDCYPRIILTNSHDGMNSFRFMLGMFRLVCENGLVVCSNQMVDMSIRHMNYDFEALRGIVASSIEQIPGIVETMSEMKRIELSECDKRELARSVVRIRKGLDEENVNEEIDEATIVDILRPVREEDKSNDLWTVFNICQEKMIKGGFTSLNSKNKMRKQRNITSIKKDVEYNQKLWNIALNYLAA